MVANGDLPVALNGNLSKALALAIPTRLNTELVERNVLRVMGTRENVVDTKCLVLELLTEVLCCAADATQHGKRCC